MNSKEVPQNGYGTQQPQPIEPGGKYVALPATEGVSREARVSMLALRAIVEHERSLKGSIAHDPAVFALAYAALNALGYLDKPIPAQSHEPGGKHAALPATEAMSAEAIARTASNLRKLEDKTLVGIYQVACSAPEPGGKHVALPATEAVSAEVSK